MLQRSNAEKKADSRIYRRSESVKNNAARIAGDVFRKAFEREVTRRERRQSMQKTRPTGFGFGERHPYGPDDSWSSQEDLRHIHDRDHYIAGETHGFSPDIV